MIRTSLLAAATLALMSSAAFAQNTAPDTSNSDGPPAQLYGGADDRDSPPPPPSPDRSNSNRQAPDNSQAQDQRSRDVFCRRDAAARTGYVTPGQAASREQTNGSLGGTIAGAALGAAIGAGSHAAGAGALIGAGAGLIAGTAIGSDNARHAAVDVQRAYSDAYYACMDEADDRGPPPGDYAYGRPPGSYAYGPPPPAYYAPYPYYYPSYYGPRVTFGFGFGGGFRDGFRGGFRHR